MLQAPVVCLDFNKHSCIVVKVTPKRVYCVPMVSSGLELKEFSVDSFLKLYNPCDYPVERAASHYLKSGDHLLVTEAAKRQLMQIKATGHPAFADPKLFEEVQILDLNGAPVGPAVKRAPKPTGQEIEDMATKPKASDKKPAAKTKAAPAKKPAAAKTKAAKPEAKAERKARAPGAGSMIVAGLMEGKTTEEILMEVHDSFPNSTAVGSTVSWYRSKLRKEGKI